MKEQPDSMPELCYRMELGALLRSVDHKTSYALLKWKMGRLSHDIHRIRLENEKRVKELKEEVGW